MVRIAFYAPMKPPTSGRPSGDRTIARGLMRALERAGFEVRLVSELRTWSGEPDPGRLRAFEEQAAAEARRLVEAFRTSGDGWRPDLWFTYHNHYKAPDLLGPLVARSLVVPYAIAEASHSRRRAEGPWAAWTARARAAIEAAQVIFSFTARDQAGLAGVAPPGRLVRLRPFLGDAALDGPVAVEATAGKSGPVRLVTVAMMRDGAKARSYSLLAEALEALPERDWTLDVVGCGALRHELQTRLTRACGERVRFHGRLEGPALTAVLDGSDVCAWPGIEEAFGMAYLEAQARGLPVAGCDTAGVGEVVVDGITGLLAPSPTAGSFAAALARLIDDLDLRANLGRQARAHIEAHHSLGAAADVLAANLTPLVASHEV